MRPFPSAPTGLYSVSPTGTQFHVPSYLMLVYRHRIAGEFRLQAHVSDRRDRTRDDLHSFIVTRRLLVEVNRTRLGVEAEGFILFFLYLNNTRKLCHSCAITVAKFAFTTGSTV